MMLTRIDPGAVTTLARRQLPRPLDVLNLIQLRDERSYARYGVAVTPAMLAVGARLRWMGHLHRPLLGTGQAERLMVVRYPSHRRFLAMTVNPYYLLINRLRERGVARFEASFTYADHEPLDLRAQPWLVVARFDAATPLEDIRELVEPQAGPLVYASHEVASANFLRGHKPSDPHPLTLPRLAAFAAEKDARLGLARRRNLSLAVYQRSHPRALLEKAR